MISDPSNIKILLLFPSLHNFFYGKNWKLSESPAPPLGPLYVATPLIKAGYQVRFVDLWVDYLGEAEYFDIFRTSDFILISCFTNAYSNIQRIIRDIRSVNKQVCIFCGGPHCNETEMHIEGSDLTIYGEAEMVITEILERLSSGKSLEDIPGISYMKEGKLVRHPGKHVIKDLDTIDPPAVQLAENKKYGYIYGTKIGKILSIITTRGCPFRCTFCTFQTIEYRERSLNSGLSFKAGLILLIMNCLRN